MTGEWPDAERKGIVPTRARVLQPSRVPDLENRYNFPPGTAAGQQIGIAEFGGAYLESDLHRFCQKMGRPVPEVKIVPVAYKPPTAQQIEHMPTQQQDSVLAESTEVMMDIQIVSGLCLPRRCSSISRHSIKRAG